jgi:hypothetical protein
MLGMVLIWFSGRPLRLKVACTLAPIALSIAFWLVYINANKITPTIYLIPSSYRGKVRIIYNESCGDEPKSEGNKRVFEIPEIGILFTKMPLEEGFIDGNEYYLVDDQGHRERLNEIEIRDFNTPATLERNLHEPSRDSLGIFNAGRLGNAGGAKTGEFQYEEFSVGTYRQLEDSSQFARDRTFDSLETYLLMKCHGEVR